MSLPPRAGLGVRAAHYTQLLSVPSGAELPGWCEVHSENFFAEGGPALRVLDQLRARWPLSLHGVGLALGSVAPLDRQHLKQLQALERRYKPALVSEHLCWGRHGDWHSNDLLPLPYSEEAVECIADRIGQVQQALGRQILVENVSCYVRFAVDQMSEWEFAVAVCDRAGCGLLLDVNNIYVNACNHGFEASDFLRGIPEGLPQELHLGGFEPTPWGLVDTHGTPVSEPVWALYAEALMRFGPLPTLIERDNDLPALGTLLAEVARADQLLAKAAAAKAGAENSTGGNGTFVAPPTSAPAARTSRATG